MGEIRIGFYYLSLQVVNSILLFQSYSVRLARRMLKGWHLVGVAVRADVRCRRTPELLHCNACGVVPAILELAEALKQEGSDVGAMWPDMANDAAHVVR